MFSGRPAPFRRLYGPHQSFFRQYSSPDVQNSPTSRDGALVSVLRRASEKHAACSLLSFVLTVCRLFFSSVFCLFYGWCVSLSGSPAFETCFTRGNMNRLSPPCQSPYASRCPSVLSHLFVSSSLLCRLSRPIPPVFLCPLTLAFSGWPAHVSP